MLEVGLFAYLTADAGVTAQVGTRVYPLVLPQQPTYPAIVYQRISTVSLGHSMDGPNHLTRVRMQFDCYAANRDLLRAKQVADALRAALDGYKGLMQTVTVHHVWRVNEQDFEDDATATASVQADYYIVFDEA